MGIKAPVKEIRKIPDLTRLVLFIRSGGRCEFNGHNRYLLEHPLTLTECNLAEAAHIVAFSEQGPRGEFVTRPEDIHAIDNLMLLCHDCHKLIDDNPEQYTVATLREYKKDHEERIQLLSSLGPDLKTSIIQLKANIREQTVAIPVAQVFEAVAPRYPSDARGLVIDLTSLYGDDEAFVQTATKIIKREIERFYSPGMDIEKTRHISLFALGPIPLLVYLGSRLSNIVPVDLYQRHRDTKNWVWKNDGEPVEYLLRTVRVGSNKKSVALLLSLSGRIHLENLPDEIDERFSIYEITLKDKEPGPNFLRLRQDLTNYEAVYQSSLRKIMSEHGKLTDIYLFPAIPAPIAVICGYELLPKVDPTFVVYDYDKSEGGFTFKIRINEP